MKNSSLALKRSAKKKKPERDWTVDPISGCANSSRAYVELCGHIERLIRGDASNLIAGQAGRTAGLIMAQLAHVHGLRPTK